MARQAGILPVNGKVGDLSFYYHKTYGFLVRRKGGAKNGKISERTRENATELGEASRTGKLIRYAVRAGLHFTGDETVTQRLTSVLSKILRRDAVNARGKRKVSEGILHSESREELRDFAFREGVAFGSVVKRKVVYDAAAGSFSLPGLVPKEDFVGPEAATHVTLKAMVAVVDAETDSYRYAVSEEVILEMDGEGEDVLLEIAVGTLDETGIRLGFVVVEFMEDVNGEMYGLREGRGLLMVDCSI